MTVRHPDGGIPAGTLNSIRKQAGWKFPFRDLDQDGVSDGGELFAASELGLTQIDLQKTENTQTRPDGTRLDGTGSVTLNGQTHNYTDAWFAENAFYRQFTDTVPLSDDASALPNMRGSGMVRDLREAGSFAHLRSSPRH